MTTADGLREMLTLLTPRGSWIQGNSARDRRGVAVWPGHPDACKWCLTGARHKVAGSDDELARGLIRTLDDLAAAEGYARDGYGLRPSTIFNDDDDTTHAKVRAFLRRAIKRAEKGT